MLLADTPSGATAIAARIARFFQSLKSPDGPWSDLPLTLAQLRVLGILASRAAGISGRELAALLNVSPSAITPLVDRLVDHGFARREEDHLDRRVTRLYATDHGHRLLEHLQAGRQDRLLEITSRLTADEQAQVERALAILERAAASSEAA
jgi:DNA-binding MarR family transcriptional regulator